MANEGYFYSLWKLKTKLHLKNVDEKYLILLGFFYGAGPFLLLKFGTAGVSSFIWIS